MKKFLTSVLLFLFVFSFLLSPKIFAQSPSPQPEKVDVYALFWPVVPGQTVADSMFWAKRLKEYFGGLFKSGEAAKSEYLIELSEKRLVEANKLLENKNYSDAKVSLDLNAAVIDEAVDRKKKAKEENQDVNELTLKMGKSLENQLKAYQYFKTQFPIDQQAEIDRMINELNLQISEAK